MQTSPSSSQPASVFVTSLGWVLMTLTGLGLFTAVMQAVFLQALLPALMEHHPQAHHMSQHMFNVVRSFNVVHVILSGFLLFAAWKLLQRRAWARQTFLVVFVLGAVWSAFVFLTAGLGVAVLHVLPPESMRHGVPADVSAILRVMAGLLGLLAAAVGWILIRLTRRLAAVRAEFGTPAAA